MWIRQEKAQCVSWFKETQSDNQVQRWHLKQMGDQCLFMENTNFFCIPSPNSWSGRWFPSIQFPKVSVHLSIGLCLYGPGYTLSFLLWRPHFSSNLRHLENKETL
ncbi:hypothetical protein AVEN_213553-1 [Araneus ventricosus]|uniref:Uncharacterized protein n=1 Tax=Araneus ventricosus TaxID=182803 RepID=A0A4Y2HJR2_ARAVE|nr:hypothetical protein AVEN_213553-1 [Araneus ventricosus]